MLHVVIFYAAQLLASAYALARGGSPERLVAAVMLVAAAATSLVPVDPSTSYRGVVSGIFAVDLGFLVVVLAVGVLADRFWPLWIAALQVIAVGVHGVRAYDFHVLPIVYSVLVGQIAYPMVLILAIGTFRHQQRVQQGRAECGWISPRW